MIAAVDERESPSDVWGTRLSRSEPPSFTEAMAKAGVRPEFTRPELRPLPGDPPSVSAWAPSLRSEASESTEATEDAPEAGTGLPDAASNWAPTEDEPPWPEDR